MVREFTRGKPPIARFACPLPQNVLSRERDFVVVNPQGIPGDSDPFSVVSMQQPSVEHILALPVVALCGLLLHKVSLVDP